MPCGCGEDACVGTSKCRVCALDRERLCAEATDSLTAARAEIAMLRGELADVLAERDGMQSVATQTSRELGRAVARIAALRNALASISVDEYESTSSASEKVHGHARIARLALKVDEL